MYTTLAFAIVGAWFMVASTVALATDLEGDPERGKILFGANGSCAGCHSLVPRRIRVGPSLASLFGRKAGSLPSFPIYSMALKTTDIVWNEKTLDVWLTVNVPSARDGGVTGIMNPVVMNADKGAGNTERHALSSSAWRFATRILNQA